MFEKNLNDLVRGIRNSKTNEVSIGGKKLALVRLDGEISCCFMAYQARLYVKQKKGKLMKLLDKMYFIRNKNTGLAQNENCAAEIYQKSNKRHLALIECQIIAERSTFRQESNIRTIENGSCTDEFYLRSTKLCKGDQVFMRPVST